MPHVFETAPTGRAKCRGCGNTIAKGDVRFGQRLPNPFGEGEMTLWFHPDCAALKQPEAFLEALGSEKPVDVDVERLEPIAQQGVTYPRLPRVNGAERSPTGRARCRSCKELIAKDAWRISLVFFADGRFEPSGHVHATCARGYFETVETVLDRVRRFSDATDADVAEIETALRGGSA